MGDTWQNQTALNLSEIQIYDLASIYYRKILLVLIKHGVTDTLQRQAGLVVFFFKTVLTNTKSKSKHQEFPCRSPEHAGEVEEQVAEPRGHSLTKYHLIC